MAYGTAAAHARAAAARDARADGTAWEVRWFNDAAELPQAWTGARYDTIALAKDLVSNPGFSGVTIYTAAGKRIDADRIPSLRY